MPKMKPWQEYSLIGVILFLLLAVFFYDIFFWGKTFKVTTASSQAMFDGVYGQSNNKPKFIPVNGTDAAVLEEPIWEFIRNNIRQGILPLWNPHQACGFPLIGMLEVGLFFPLHLILIIFPNIYAWDILILSRFLLSGLFIYILMRRWRFSRASAIISAIVFMFSGPMIVLQYWTVNVDILAPLIILCLEELIAYPTLRRMVGTALVVALTFFAGHPEHIFLVNVVGFLFFCFRLYTRRDKTNPAKAIKLLFISYALGIGLAAVVLLPFLFNLKYEFWHGHPPGTGLTTGEFRERIITLGLPFFFQKETLDYEWNFSGWWGGYLGILPLMLAIVSLFNRHKHFLNYFFVILAFLMIAKSYSFAFINWIGYLPVFDNCRYYIHTPHLVALCVSLAAGMGVRTVIVGKKAFLKSRVLSVVFVIVIGINLWLVRSTHYWPTAIAASRFAWVVMFYFLLILWFKDNKKISKQFAAGCLIFILCFELFNYVHRERVYRFNSFPKVPYIDFLKKQEPRARSYGIFWDFYPNTATGFGVDDFGIFFSLLPKRFVYFVNTLIKPNNFQSDLRPPALRAIPLVDQGKEYLNLLNVKYFVSPPTPDMRKLLNNFDEIPLFQNRVYSGEANIYPRRLALERSFVVHRTISTNDEKTVPVILKQIEPLLNKVIVINNPPSSIIVKLEHMLKSAPPDDNSQAQVISYSANEVLIDADLKNPGLVVLSDSFHPEWKAYVDGNPSYIFQTDYLIRSVLVDRGKHRIRFAFQPASFYIGGWISLLCALIVLIVWTKSHRQNPI